MDTTTIPAPILATLAPASVTATVNGEARLILQETQEALTLPLAMLPRGVGVGATVYLRVLSAAEAGGETDAVARRVLEQFLN